MRIVNQWRAGAAMAFAVIPAASAMALQEAPQAVVTPAKADEAATTTKEDAESVARRVCERLKTIAPDSDATRFEAEIVFALSQTDVDLKVKQEALSTAGSLCPMGAAMTLALNNASSSIGTGGTAGLADAFFPGSTGFSSPSVDVGGGSVNYAL
ncbi:hypothetical protein [uncultured Sphingomonas sp.]|uniref:hypothetical protein n=1 Tax=uncultured Sphingomonas sp. TaxID=158754 RepID=UPI0025FFE04A|nr:hypothetical protein [uncultured Sphingomonas sp.]